MSSQSYVFKLHYDDGPSPTTRRYGYQGELALQQVYTGLHDRASQVFHLARSDIVLSVRDTLGNPSLALDSFSSFVTHVCAPLEQHPEHAKIDDKKRVVLVFVVQSKAALERAQRKAAHKAAKAAAAEKRKIEEVAEAAEKKQEREDKAKKAAEEKAAAAEKGYAPAYTAEAPSASQETLVEPRKADAASPTVVEEQPAAPLKSKEQLLPEDKAEAWSGVKMLLGKFVRDLNAHLADTFGDEAAPFEFREPSTEDVEAEKVKEVKLEMPAVQPEVEQPVHFDVYCDHCLKTIVGPRFKCVSCTNYDLDAACVDTRGAFHPAHHTFAEIARPHAVPVTSTRGAVVKVEPEQEQTTAPMDVPAVKEEPKVEAKPTPAPVHPATCDICHASIVGVRYKCLNCGDWDACASCYSSRIAEVHPHHNFVEVHDPAHCKHRAQPGSRVIHRNITCDGCEMSPLVGVRYHCTHPSCADNGGYDLCAACESSPLGIHPQDHNLLKIREPLNPFVAAQRSIITQATQRAQSLIARVEQGAESAGLAALSSGPIANLLESLGVHVPAALTASGAEEKPAASPKVAHAELVDGPGKDKTLVVDVDVSQLPYEQLEGLPSEIRVPVTLGATEQAELVEALPQRANTDEGLARTVAGAATDGRTEEVAEEEEEEVSTVAPVEPVKRVQDDSPRGVFVSDITLLDGSVIPAGSEFHKVWAVRNNGTAAWPAGTRLVHVSGFSSRLAGALNRPKSFDVSAVAPGEVAEVQCECKAPEEAGRFMDFWRLAAPDGTRFGDRLWVDVTVEAEGDRAQAGADGMTGSGSLSSSSFVAPSLNAAGKAASLPPSEAAASPVVAPSSSGFSVPSHLAPSSAAVSVMGGDESEFESVQAGTASRAGSEGVYVSDDDEDSSDLDESDESSESSDSDDSSDEESEDDSADEFVVVDSDVGEEDASA
ncbi:hypothetical protein JCM10450v2_002657 [Rhodotorula kratochvilovae]